MSPVLTYVLIFGLGVLFVIMFIYSFYLLLSSSKEPHPDSSFKDWKKRITQVFHKRRSGHV